LWYLKRFTRVLNRRKVQFVKLILPFTQTSSLIMKIKTATSSNCLHGSFRSAAGRSIVGTSLASPLLLKTLTCAILMSTFGALSAWSQTTISWNGSQAGGTYSTGANWVGGVAPANTIANSGNIAQFSTTTSGRMPNLTADRSVYGMIFEGRNWALNSTSG
jgi:hypothetical protein